MPNFAKSWCVHPFHDIFDPITGKKKFVKSGQNPTHPLGIHRIDGVIASYINRQYPLIIESTSKKICEGDKICTNCWRQMSKKEFAIDNSEIDVGETMSIDEVTWINSDNNNDHEKIGEESSGGQVNHDTEDLPSSQEQKYTREEAKTKLNIVFELLNIPTIRDSRRLKHIRENVHVVCSVLHTLCDMLLETEDESIKNNLSMKDTNALLSGFNKLFQQSGDIEQIRLLTISPDSWGRKMVQKWFNCSEYQARQALLLKKNKGFLAFPEYSTGNKPLADGTIKLITEFYLEDGISRASSRKKDVIHIDKVPIPVRFMEITGREAFQQFINQYPAVGIGKSSFYALRPRQVKYNTPLETCLCIYHENMQLLLKSWNKLLKNNTSNGYTSLEPINEKYLIDRMVCSIAVEDCFNRRCDICSTINPSDILLENINIDKDDTIPWSQWRNSNNKVDLHHINGSINSFLDEIDGQWATFLLHWYRTSQQKEYIKTLRLNSSESTYIVVQLDFAENFKIFQQREVQGYHWNNKQVTIFTVHLKIGSINKNIVIISDYMSHNTGFVYVAQGVVVNFIKKNFPSVKKISYLSDGASSHFKNNFNKFNLVHQKEDFGLEACWTYTSTAHGKGPSDGIGASVKSTATRHIISSGISIFSAEEFYQFTVKFNDNAAETSMLNEPPIYAFYVDSTTVENVYNDLLKPRWEKLNKTDRIKHIRSFHQFDVRADQTIVYKHISNSMDFMTFTYKIKDDFQSSIQRVHTSNDIYAGTFVIINYNDNFHLAQINVVDHTAQKVQVKYYEPAFPSTTFYVSRSKNRNSRNTNIHNIILLVRYNPIVGKQDEVYLNPQQFHHIEQICEEF